MATLAAVVAAAVVGLVVALAPPGLASTTPAAGGPDGVAVSVVGNHLVDASGNPLRLVGVDRSGTEYACAQGWGIFDGPSDAASVAAIRSWHTNAVRVPLNEDCWLGINDANPAVSGPAYRAAITGYVHELNQAGIIAVIDLHWGAPGTTLATTQEAMPDADHAPAFWQSAAATFASTPGVVFDLFNEPHDVTWSCWLNGCAMPGGWAAAGMQTLLNTIRAAGATQPVMVEPLGYGGDLSGFLANEPVDPDHALVASLHLYNPSGCNTLTCWNQVIAPVAAQLPVVTGELGEYDCSSNFVDSYMDWADAHGVSYLAWTWDAGGGWTCSQGPALLNDYTGTANSFGAGVQAHYAALATVHTSYQQTQSWSNGGVGDLTITNTGTTPVGTAVNPWAVRFALPAGTTTSNMWNADLVSDTDGVITATAPSYTPSLAPGQQITIGYVFAGPAVTPTQIDLDGTPTAP